MLQSSELTQDKFITLIREMFKKHTDEHKRTPKYLIISDEYRSYINIENNLHNNADVRRIESPQEPLKYRGAYVLFIRLSNYIDVA